jgi:putative chitinase
MRAHEFINEDWKQNLASIGTGAALAFGGTNGINQKEVVPIAPKQVSTKPTVTDNSNPASILKKFALKAGITGKELSALMSQAAHETLDFTRMIEHGSKSYFQKYETPKMAKVLGNTDKKGNVIHGAGEKFKGRSFLQITGKYNYELIGKELGIPLGEHPEMLEDPKIGAMASIWYWKHRVAPKINNFGDIRKVTYQINPGLAGLASREKKFQAYNNSRDL